MLFCPKCGSLMIPSRKENKRVLKCNSCAYIDTNTKNAKLSEKVKETKEISVIEREIESDAKCDAKCRKCGHGVAYYWFLQTRASDEPATQFFKCEKCSTVWKEY